jgi:transaldolase
MKFFLDTANLDELKECAARGIIDGVTTHPSRIANERVTTVEQIRRICEIVEGDISSEVVSSEAMIRERRESAGIHKNVAVKVPMTRDGIQACSALSQESHRVNVTLCFSARQALLAAKAGAWFISSFVGRLDDMGAKGMDLIHQIVTIYKSYDFKTQVLAASLRNANHVIDSALAGAHVATPTLKVYDTLFNHPLIDKGLEQFLKDYRAAFEEVPVAV